MEPVAEVDNSKESYRQFFQSLEPNAHGKIHVSTFKELLKKAMGDKYDEESTLEMIADISPDVDGKIPVDGLAEIFTMGPRNSKLALTLHNLLGYSPKNIPTPDLTQFVKMFGIDISHEKAMDVIGKARVSLLESLDKRFDGPAPKSKKEIKEEKIRLMKKLEKQIVALGGTVPNLDDEEVESD